MKQLLNTLYVTTQGAYLAREGETLWCGWSRSRAARPDPHAGQRRVFRAGIVQARRSWDCARSGCCAGILDGERPVSGARAGPVSGNVLLRREQYRRAEDESRAAEIARSIVMAKVANCRTVLLRAAREKPDGAEARTWTRRRCGWRVWSKSYRNRKSLDTVRGHEGDAARVYFVGVRSPDHGVEGGVLLPGALPTAAAG